MGLPSSDGSRQSSRGGSSAGAPLARGVLRGDQRRNAPAVIFVPPYHSAAGTRHGPVIHQWNISPSASITNRNARRLAGRTRCLSSHGSFAANKALAATNGSVCLSGTNPVRKATKLARMPSVPAKNITMLSNEADRSGRARRIRLMLESVALLNRNCRTPRVRVQQSFAMHVDAVVSAAS